MELIRCFGEFALNALIVSGMILGFPLAALLLAYIF